jgi:serine/threonine protein kinase/Tfp pilus assembly protein PilF
MIGQTLGHYRILEKVGAGGMGVVYRARDEQLERDVALKVLPSGTLDNEASRRNFRKEALALAKLNHPNIETVYEFATQDGMDFLVMEFVPGKTLADRLLNGALPEKEVVALGMQIAAALGEAHERGIVHRDLKPRNIAITAKGQAKVLDFGLAKLLRPASVASTDTITDTQAIVGTLPYMSPEQLQGEAVDARSDIFTIGAVLYEMATNCRAFGERLPSRLVDTILHETPVTPRALNRRISAGLERIILKCLDKDPEQRYQSAKELLVDLRRLGEPASARTNPPASIPKGRTKAARSAAYFLAGLVGLTAIVLGLNVGGWRTRLVGWTSPPKIGSLAVLPLENLSHDPEQEYFADGMTEALITDIAKIGTLRVISRTSVMRYKGTKKPLSQIARELNVDAIVEGSVQHSGDRVRIDAQLIDARNDRNLWTESYQSDLGDVLTLQGNVARAVAGEVRAQLTPQESASLSKKQTVNPRAYESYLQGRYFWNKRTPGDLKAAIKSFNGAIEIDPSYALAYAGLADSYSLLSVYGEVSPREAMPLAKAAAKRALEIDDTVAEAQAALADIQWAYDWDPTKAEAGFRHALALNPNYASAHQWYAVFLSNHGRHEEAIAEIERAREIDPLSLIIQANAGFDYYYARQYERAIETLQKAAEREPNFWVFHLMLGQTYLAMGRMPEATSEFEKANSLSPENVRVSSMLGLAYAKTGRLAEARKLVEEMLSLSRKRYVSPALIAIVQIGLGENDKAFDWLNKACLDRSDWMIFLNTDPLFDPLRADPRFHDLLTRVGFQT